MAMSITTHTGFSPRGMLSGVFDAIGRATTQYLDAKSHQAEYQDLIRLSDRELADIGLRRDQIISHVFRDVPSV